MACALPRIAGGTEVARARCPLPVSTALPVPCALFSGSRHPAVFADTSGVLVCRTSERQAFGPLPEDVRWYPSYWRPSIAEQHVPMSRTWLKLLMWVLICAFLASSVGLLIRWLSE